jgi:flagellar hook-associated protein 1 FlgK
MLHNGYDNTQMSIDFDYTVGNFPGPGNNENAVEIAALRDELTMSPDHAGNYTATFTDFYSGLIGQIGLDRNSATSNRDTREYLINQYEDSQEAIAGVSLDEEMSNLIKYQHTYQASAKIVSTAQQMLDVLMNL